MAADPPNEALSQLLAGLSWSGERLAREICRVLGDGAVHPTAPYKWLKGHQPRRDAVRQVTAFVLSQASSQRITGSELWPGCAPRESLLVPAVVGMEVPWTLAGTLAIAHDWLSSSPTSRAWGSASRRRPKSRRRWRACGSCRGRRSPRR